MFGCPLTSLFLVFHFFFSVRKLLFFFLFFFYAVMLPQFQYSARDATRSINSSASFMHMNPPRYYEDLLSSVETDRTLSMEESLTVTRPPSPSPLIFVSVPLPLEHGGALRCLTRAGEVAGLVRSPARASEKTNASYTTTASIARVNYAIGLDDALHTCRDAVAASYMAQSSDASSSEADGSDDDSSSSSNSSVQFDCKTISNTSDVSTDGSCPAGSLSRSVEWGVVWLHIFPKHIAGFLTVRDMTAVALVCRTSYAAVRQPWVWRALAASHFAVHPASVERVFNACVATTAAVARDDDAEKEAAVVDERTQRLLVAEPRAATPSSARLRTFSPQAREGVEEEARTVAVSTATVPWLMHENTETLASEDGVEMSEDEADDAEHFNGDAEEGYDPDGELNLTQPPTTSHTEDAAEADTATAVSTMAVARVATRAALAANSRYLWQTAAAAMPSPSSPVTSPLPEDEEKKEGDNEDMNAEANMDACVFAALPSTAVPAVSSPPPPVAAAGTTVPCTAPSERARPPTPSPLSSAPSLPVCVAATAAATAERLTTAREAKNHTSGSGGSGGKCSAGMNRAAAAVCEQLPPPSPAQLDCATSTGCLLHVADDVDADEEAAAMTDVLPSSAAASPTLYRHPSYVLEQATDVAMTSADVVAPALSTSSLREVCDAPSPEAAPVRCYTLCRATAERTLLRARPCFPWQYFTRFLYTNRVQSSLARYDELSRRARTELCRGAWDSAYGSLSHVVHALFQQGSCRGVEHLLRLAQALVRRASLCRHRGHVHLLAAFTDLCTAALLSPDCVDPAEVAELCARDELSALTPESWLQHYNDATHVASPVSLLGTVAQVPFLFPQHRTLCFCSSLAAYMRAYRVFGQTLTHLLCRAAEWATPGTEEELLVRALRETAQAKRCPPRCVAHFTRKACATADYALSLTSLDVRRAIDVLVGAWMRDCFSSEGAVHAAAMTQWTARSPDAATFARSTALDTRWLAWLTCEVHTFVYKELTDKLPARAAVTSVVLALTDHDRADGLVRIAAQYANYDVRTEDLDPPLPCHTNRRRVTQLLLHNALRLRPLHSTAALLLSHVYAAAEAAEEAEDGVSMASTVLTDCIHCWARRFSLLELGSGGAALTRRPFGTAAAPTYLHRRDRSPEVCYIPAELLVGRNRCLHMVADLAEATEQHQTLSFPYQMRAAMAMDRGYHLAAILELGRVMALSLDAGDVALRVRLLQDAVEAPSPLRTPRVTDEAPTPASATAASGDATTTMPAVVSRSASFESALRSHDAAAAVPSLSLTVSPSHSPLLESSLQLRPTYRVWLARMSGLLALLRPLECFAADGEGDDDAVMFSAGQSRSRRFSHELPSMTTRGYGSDHVSRVASLAFSETEGEGAVLNSWGSGIDASHVRAFLDELVDTAGGVFAVTN